MLVIPAIDILGGKCVRLYKGDYDAVKEYADDPIEIAKKFEREGAKYLHVIDLDGAKNGYTVNKNIIIQLANSVNIPIQVGGGVRTFDDAVFYLENGVDRIILGTSLLEDLNLVEILLKEFGERRIFVSMDVKDNKIVTRGWLKQATSSIEKVLKQLKEVGIKNIIVTDVTKDGTLSGANINFFKFFIDKGFSVSAAGGISNQKDISSLRKSGVYECIVGKAIYEGKIGINSSFLAKRIIPCLDVENGRVVKGTSFTNLRDAGDPVELGKYYAENGADELTFLDISATLEGRKTFLNLVSDVSKNVFIPFTVGGGISTLEDIRNLLCAGADKVSIGSAAVKNPEFIKEAAKEFGSQCIVISLDCKKNGDSWELYVKSGKEKANKGAINFAQEMESLGAGELLVNSIDKDGQKNGYDLELLDSINSVVNIPVIASSGAGSKEDFLKAFAVNISACLAASIFHFGEIEIRELKEFLLRNGIIIRS